MMSKRLILAVTVLGLVFMASCSKVPSVHKYYVDHETTEGFRSFIVPSNLLSLKDSVSSDEETLKAMNDLKSLYVLMYSATDDPLDKGDIYLEELKSSMEGRYSEMFNMLSTNQNVKVVVNEDDGQISEIIALIEHDEGFAMARITGDIHLDQLIKVFNKIDISSLMKQANVENTWM